MSIQAPTPLVIPATPEKVFDLVWIREFSVIAHDSQSGTIRFKLGYVSSQTGEQAPPEHDTPLNVPLWKVAHDVPEAMAAMAAVFDAVPAIQAWQDEQKAKAKAEAEAREAAAQQEAEPAP